MIKFGTDGWRAILDKDFTLKNVERVTLAIGKYVYETFGYRKLILVGYDPRRMAAEYAEKCAEILVNEPEKPIHEVADELGVNRATLWKWRQREDYKEYEHQLCHARFLDLEKLAIEKLGVLNE